MTNEISVEQAERMQSSGRMGIKGVHQRRSGEKVERVNTEVHANTKAALRRLASERRVSIGVVIDMLVRRLEKAQAKANAN